MPYNLKKFKLKTRMNKSKLYNIRTFSIAKVKFEDIQFVFKYT